MTAVERVRAALSEIERTEPRVHAWVHIDAERALSDAERIDERVAHGDVLSLAGLTVGVKDIFDVAGMPTRAGFVPYAERIAGSDATCVAALRAAGAVIIGKTVTTQFAVGDPPVTRNPWNVERTPGGSSSGSAAAVAAGHVDVALGSQTAGSTLRPAAYCGIVGFKPAFGAIPRRGMLPLAASLDHVGLLARSVGVLTPVLSALTVGAPDESPVSLPRLGVWAEPTGWAASSVQAAFQSAIDSVRKAGATIGDAPEPIPYADILAIHATIMAAEVARSHQRLYPLHRECYAPYVRSMVEVGMTLPAYAYASALRLRDVLRDLALERWTPFDAIALPTVDTTAPTPETTGNRALQAAATLLGLPSISIPIGLGDDGLPIGLQLIAPHPAGACDLLRIARWVETLISPLPAPNVADGALG
jgi:aspartyl-tRNA(Asn)/glutamyl-tRNA(Gln) amidotransferase subunit A